MTHELWSVVRVHHFLQGLAFNIQGTGIPDTIGGTSILSNLSLALPNLKLLNISNSRMGDHLFALRTLTKLEILDISRTFTWGNPSRDLMAFCGLTSLKVLVASEAGLSAKMDTLSLSACFPNLQVVRLGGNRDISGTLPAGVSSWDDLAWMTWPSFLLVVLLVHSPA